MLDPVRRLKTPLGALAVAVLVALSAAAVAAGSPPAAADRGLERARDASGLDVPLGAGTTGETEEATEPDSAPEDELDADDDPAEAAEGTHGALVSEAARMETPDGFANHGAFVRCVAHMKDLDPAAPPVDLEALTPEDCEPSDEATDAGADAEAAASNGKGKGQGKAKAERGPKAGKGNAPNR